jgi:type I restriction enzyme S subunit
MTLRVHPDEIVAEAKSALLGIHSSWERVRLKEVATVQNGFAFKSAQFSKSDGMPLLRIRDVGRSTTETRYLGDYDPGYVVREGDLIVGMDGDFRVARWAGADALLNQRVCRITVRSEDHLDSRFLLYSLPGYLDAINARTSSVTVKHLSSRTVEQIPLPLPPIEEQRRTVAAIEEQLSRLDAVQESLKRAERGLRRLQGSVLASSITSWPEVSIKDIGEVFVGSTPSRRKPELWGGPIPWVSSGEVSFAHIRSTRETIAEDAATRIHPPGTVLLAMIGEGRTRGQAAILDVAAAHNQNSAAIRLQPAKCLPEWLFYVFLARYEQTRRVGVGGQQPALNRSRVEGIALPLPPIEEQRRIVAEIEQRLSVIHAMYDSIEAAQRHSAALRRSILERAFRGELVPQDPSDEPASVLLERIRAERAAAKPPARRRRVAAGKRAS